MTETARATDVYVVVKQGVYIQDVYGAFLDMREARAHAQHCAMHDVDGYHSYDVWPLTRDGIGESSLGSYTKCDKRSVASLWNSAVGEQRARERTDGRRVEQVAGDETP